MRVRYPYNSYYISHLQTTYRNRRYKNFLKFIILDHNKQFRSISRKISSFRAHVYYNCAIYQSTHTHTYTEVESSSKLSRQQQSELMTIFNVRAQRKREASAFLSLSLSRNPTVGNSGARHISTRGAAPQHPNPHLSSESRQASSGARHLTPAFRVGAQPSYNAMISSARWRKINAQLYGSFFFL